MKKILVIGPAGSGKTVFSRELGNKTGIPVFHLDSLYWKPGWEPSSQEEWEGIIKKLVNKPTWIIDGNFSRTLDYRLEKADTVFFFDFQRRINLYRAVKRRVMYRGRNRPDLNPNCPEKLDLPFILGIWNFKKKKRGALLNKLKEKSKNKRIIVFRTPKMVEKFLEKL